MTPGLSTLLPSLPNKAQLMSEGASHFDQYGVYPTFSSEEELKVLLTLHSSQRSAHTPKGSLPQMHEPTVA